MSAVHIETNESCQNPRKKKSKKFSSEFVASLWHRYCVYSVLSLFLRSLSLCLCRSRVHGGCSFTLRNRLWLSEYKQMTNINLPGKKKAAHVKKVVKIINELNFISACWLTTLFSVFHFIDVVVVSSSSYFAPISHSFIRTCVDRPTDRPSDHPNAIAFIVIQLLVECIPFSMLCLLHSMSFRPILTKSYPAKEE